MVMKGYALVPEASAVRGNLSMVLYATTEALVLEFDPKKSGSWQGRLGTYDPPRAVSRAKITLRYCGEGHVLLYVLGLGVDLERSQCSLVFLVRTILTF